MEQLDDLDPERIYKAIYQGVYDAMWQMMTNATDAPCQDFYETIKRAAEEAFSGLADRVDVTVKADDNGT